MRNRIAGSITLLNEVSLKRQTASAYLKQLVDIGVLEEMSVGREKLFINTRLVQRNESIR